MSRHDIIEYRNGKYIPWWRGKSYGRHNTLEDARLALWNGPLLQELTTRQRELWLQRQLQRLAEEESTAAPIAETQQHTFLEE
jgi:hypothetical protein